VPKGSYRNAGPQAESLRLSGRAAAFQVRQRRAGWIVPEGKDGLARALMTPDFAAVRALFAVPIKIAPFTGNIRQQSEALPQPWR
jgi:hypothetical protein